MKKFFDWLASLISPSPSAQQTANLFTNQVVPSDQLDNKCVPECDNCVCEPMPEVVEVAAPSETAVLYKADEPKTFYVDVQNMTPAQASVAVEKVVENLKKDRKASSKKSVAVATAAVKTEKKMPAKKTPTKKSKKK